MQKSRSIHTFLREASILLALNKVFASRYAQVKTIKFTENQKEYRPICYIWD